METLAVGSKRERPVVQCHACGEKKDLWICLECGIMACGRTSGEHAQDHYRMLGAAHSRVASVQWREAWDYEKDDFVVDDRVEAALVSAGFPKPEAPVARAMRGLDLGGGGGGRGRGLAGVLRGLRNLGNTCYLNSSLQALGCVPGVLDALEVVAAAHGALVRHRREQRLRSAELAAAAALRAAEEAQRAATEAISAERAAVAAEKAQGAEEGEEAYLPPKSAASAASSPGVSTRTSRRSTGTAEISVSRELLEVLRGVRDVESGNGEAVVPMALRGAIAAFMPIFAGYRQHDAHEFLRFLLSRVEEEALEAWRAGFRWTTYLPLGRSRAATRLRRLTTPSLHSSSSSSTTTFPPTTTPSPTTPSPTPSPTPTPPPDPVTALFQGELVSRVHCLECGHTSFRVDPCADVSVPFPPEWSIPLRRVRSGWVVDGLDVSKLLKRFALPEELHPSEWPYCAHCAKRTKSTKWMMVKTPPPVLVVHLKRFRFRTAGTLRTACSKVRTLVATPTSSTHILRGCIGSQEYMKAATHAHRSFLHNNSGSNTTSPWAPALGEETVETHTHPGKTAKTATEKGGGGRGGGGGGGRGGVGGAAPAAPTSTSTSTTTSTTSTPSSPTSPTPPTSPKGAGLVEKAAASGGGGKRKKKRRGRKSLEELEREEEWHEANAEGDGEPDQGPSFSLVSAIQHHGGGLGSGHYTALCKEKGQWAIADDGRVKSSDEDAAAATSEASYILFFARDNLL